MVKNKISAYTHSLYTLLVYAKDLKITGGNECCKNSSSEVPVSLA